MSWTDWLLENAVRIPARRLERAAHSPLPAQQKALGALLRRIGGTELGKRSGFGAVQGTEGMRKLSPTLYEGIQQDITRVLSHGRNAKGLFGLSDLVGIACTSGTTREPKRIPITRDYVAAYHRFTLGMNAAYLHSVPRTRSTPRGKIILLTARPRIGTTPGGLPEGFISGFMASRTPKIYRARTLPSTETLHLSNWEEKIAAIFREARDENVTAIAGIPALALTFSEHALEHYGIRSLREIWPNLRTFLYSGVALSGIERNRFARAWGCGGSDGIRYWEMYAATEAQIGHTLDIRLSGMVFNPFHNFYQFRETESGPYAHLHELERGKRYMIFVTTPGGLVNYQLGDWIEILSVKPLLFRVAGRDKEEISIATEKINLNQVKSALAKAAEELGARIEDFAIWLELGKPNRLVCGIPPVESGDRKSISRAIDSALQENNPSYREMRINALIYDRLRVEEIPAAVFRGYRERNADRGQFKPKQLFTSRESFEREYGFSPKRA